MVKFVSTGPFAAIFRSVHSSSQMKSLPGAALHYIAVYRLSPTAVGNVGWPASRLLLLLSDWSASSSVTIDRALQNTGHES